MPAPQASMMQQFARLKFTSFSIKVPSNWQEPSGDAGKQYSDAVKPEERTTAPGAPPLFQPASANKYHTDAQKMHIAKIGKFIDDTCSAICSAWSKWQSMAMIQGFVVVGPLVSVGVLAGPPLQPLIISGGAPMGTANETKYSNVIAGVISDQWTAFCATVICPGLPFFPAYAALPITPAPPMPNVPFPIGVFTQAAPLIGTNVLKALMVTQLGDPNAPFASQLFESIANAFEQCYDIWKMSTMVTNATAIATGGTPISPLPAAGTAMMPPGGLA